MELKAVIGDYESFFDDIYVRLIEMGIDITGYPLSHLGLRAETFRDYEVVRENIKRFCISYAENVHNDRPISKLLLREPLTLPHGFTVRLIELMPPKKDHPYPPGLEHVGVVIGKDVEAFAEAHKNVISGRQDQGPYCQPFFITFDNDKRVKFYDISLKDVVEKEGTIFERV